MKKNILFAFGLGDTFCDSQSHRCIKRGQILFDQSLGLLKESKHNFYGAVRINEPSDTFNSVNLIKDVNPRRVIDVKLCANSIFSKNNQISIFGSDGHTLLDGDQLDHVLIPEEFDIYISGIDINGVFINSITELLEKKYNVTVFSDIIKPFSKATIDYIKRSKARFGKS